ncbi:hypothetical protein KY290_029786 [Solanum tuberosum]|uniref:Uncharacterized protein n=1 Tax=Solanum tuberosum TaxID=4113 RepID=A0ABQ7ULQ8_SOLTU|nr:hypothetical protein KY285_028830 [Solanum tuberosum]KAH0750554.1 hypothetical protein KY290_029786 [Solanum tuberosum]
MRYLVDYVAFQEWEHLFEWPVPSLHQAKVRKFSYNMEIREDGSNGTKVHDVEIDLSEDILGVILEVPCLGIRSMDEGLPLKTFISPEGKIDGLKCVGIPKKYLKGIMPEHMGKVMTTKGWASWIGLCVPAKPSLQTLQWIRSSADVQAELAELLESNAKLNEQVKVLTKQMLQAHTDTNTCMTLLLQSFALQPLPS